VIKNDHAYNNCPKATKRKRDSETEYEIAKLIEDYLGKKNVSCYLSSFLSDRIRDFIKGSRSSCCNWPARKFPAR
jgi:hypothetical protein